jgi:hypothetical protein
LPLEFLLLQGIFRDNEVFGSEAILLFGLREVVTILGILGVLGVTLVLVPLRGIVVLFGGMIAELPHVDRSLVVSGSVCVSMTFPTFSSPSGSPSWAFGRFFGGTVTVFLGRVAILYGGVDHVNVV